MLQNLDFAALEESCEYDGGFDRFSKTIRSVAVSVFIFVCFVNANILGTYVDDNAFCIVSVWVCLLEYVTLDFDKKE